MRPSRLLSLLLLLQLRGRVPAAALAREFEVSVRTIYRDVDALSASGVPVYAERGRLGGIALHEGYRTRLTGLTPAEAQSLPLAGAGGAARDLGLGDEAMAAQLKLMASLPPDAGASARHIAERFHLDPLPWYHRAEAVPSLPALARAAWQDRCVRIAYDGWQGATRRVAEPLGLVLKGGLWYLVASTRGGAPRTFRVANIRELQVLDATFARPRGFALSAHWPHAVADFEARLMREQARVRISDEGRSILRSVNPAAAERVDATMAPVAARRGWCEAQMPIESPAYSARQLLRLGAEVEVLAPPALRQALRRELARIQRLYAARPRAPRRPAAAQPG